MIEDIEIVLPTYIHVQHITQLVSSQASLNKQWLVSKFNITKKFWLSQKKNQIIFFSVLEQIRREPIICF